MNLPQVRRSFLQSKGGGDIVVKMETEGDAMRKLTESDQSQGFHFIE